VGGGGGGGGMKGRGANRKLLGFQGGDELNTGARRWCVTDKILRGMNGKYISQRRNLEDAERTKFLEGV